MTTIIGIDPSLTGTGVAVFRDRKLFVLTITSEAWDDVNGWERPARNDRIRQRLRQHTIDYPRSTVAVMEGRIPPVKDRGWESAMNRAELRGVIDNDLFQQGIPIARPAPGTLKKYATHRGNASKQDMVRAARDVLGTRVPIGNDNEADAFWLMAMGVHRYGLADGDLFGTVHAPSLDKVTWPPFHPMVGVL